KGETLLDTVDNLCAMNADLFVVRHSQSGAPHLIASHLDATGRSHVHVVNAGDGRHAHPTQGLLDLYTIRHYKREFGGLVVAVVGVASDMREGLRGCDVVVMLRLQSERMKGALLPSAGEFFKQYGLTQDKLALAKP